MNTERNNKAIIVQDCISLFMSHNSLPIDITSLEISPFADAMLAVLNRHHKGEENAAKALQLAIEMQKEHPHITKGKKLSGLKGGIGTAGHKLVKQGLIKCKRWRSDPSDPESFDVYWYWVE